MKRIHFKKTLKTHFKKNPFLAVVFSRPKSFFFKYIFSKFNWDFFLPEEWNILELVISFFFNLKYIWILQAIYRHDSDNSIMEFDFFFLHILSWNRINYYGIYTIKRSSLIRQPEWLYILFLNTKFKCPATPKPSKIYSLDIIQNRRR